MPNPRELLRTNGKLCLPLLTVVMDSVRGDVLKNPPYDSYDGYDAVLELWIVCAETF